MQDGGMGGLVKSTVLGAALLTAMALAAQAQSVSPSPAAGGTPVQVAHPFGPKPSGGHTWKQEHYQNPADYATNRAYHPYSMGGVGQSQGPYFGSAPRGGVAQPASSGSTQGPKTN
jgi:hypothetical protein